MGTRKRNRVGTAIGLFSSTGQPIHVPVGGNCPLQELAILVSIILFFYVQTIGADENIVFGNAPLASVISSPEEVCSAGFYPYSASQGTVCIPCDDTSYKIESGNFNCTDCPDGSRTNKDGATRISDCVCSPGMYRQEVYVGEGSEDSIASNCTICPSGGVCDGYRDEISSQPGYWLDTIPTGNNSVKFEILACFGYQNCLGNNMCAEGWGENLCSLCASDNGNKANGKYFSFFGSCKRCYSTAVNVLLHISVYACWILLNLFVAHQYTVVALAIDWMQLMSIIGNINGGWPESVQWFLNIARFFSFDLDVVSWQCISNWNFFWEMLFQFLLPFALSLFWILLLCPTVLYNAIKQHVNTLKKHIIRNKWIKDGHQMKKGQFGIFTGKLWDQMKAILTSLGFLDIFHNEINLNFLKAKILVSFESTYVISTYYALSALSYRDIGGDAFLFMAPYYQATTKCMILGIIGLVFFSIGFPIFLLLRCMTFEPNDDEDPGKFGDKSVRERYGWLYSRFRIRKWKLAFCIFLHRFMQICSVVFIADPGMALNVTFVINLLFGLFVGLQHPNISLKLNAIEYLTMLSTVTTVLCGMWFNWLNTARDYSTNTSRVLLDDLWSQSWLNDLVEICALVNLGLTCFLFLYAALLEFVDIRCFAKSLAEIRNIFSVKPSDNRRRENWHYEDFQSSRGTIVEYLQPIVLRSWVDKIQQRCPDPEKERERKQLLNDFEHTSFAISKFVANNPRANAFSLSKDAILWRKLLSQYPSLLSFLLYAQDSVKKSYICFFKEFYSLYWNPSRRSAARFLYLIPGWQKMTAVFGNLITPASTSNEAKGGAKKDDEIYKEYIKHLKEDLENGRPNFENRLCLSCRSECDSILEKHYTKATQMPIYPMEEGSIGTFESSSPSSQSSLSSHRAFSIIGGMCRRAVLHCNGHYCEEVDAAHFFQGALHTLRHRHEVMRSTEISCSQSRNDESHHVLDDCPSLWKECPPDISRLFQRRHRASIAYWLAYISTIDEKADREQYARYRGERMRFVRLMNSITNNQHKSGLEKFARILMFGNMSVLNKGERYPKKLEDVFPNLDGDHFSQPCTSTFCRSTNTMNASFDTNERSPRDSANEQI